VTFWEIIQKWFSRKLALVLLIFGVATWMLIIDKLNGTEWNSVSQMIFWGYVIGNVGTKAVTDIPKIIGRFKNNGKDPQKG